MLQNPVGADSSFGPCLPSTASCSLSPCPMEALWGQALLGSVVANPHRRVLGNLAVLEPQIYTY